ncbi:MAG: cytochrome c oxidase subunit 3 [Candidatus Solibacter usitatus]|nr:cytochrome c oxidase subunit 3 [Candidatus Solibacter usitatus]
MEITAAAQPANWDGGVSPFGIGWSKLMMWLFIVSDGLVFAGFLAIYGFIRLASPDWPDRSRMFHLDFIALMTFTLISSSATMATAVAAAREGNRKTVLRFLLLTVLGGCAFLGMQAYEWTGLIREGAGLGSNPWGAPLFGACFFVLTGFHGSHVLSGVIVLAMTAVRSRMGMARAEGVELAGLYWHFVDLVWVFIFTLFYLI